MARLHSLHLTGTLSSLASVTETSLGTITLPTGSASDRWRINFAWVSVVPTTQAQSNGILRIASNTGDVTPQPSPLRLLTSGSSAQQATPAVATVQPPDIYALDHIASGKSVLELLYTALTPTTLTYHYSAGLMISDYKIAGARDIKYSDYLHLTGLASTSETSVGTFTLPEGAKRLTAACCMVFRTAAMATSEPVQGVFRLASSDVQLTPLTLPISNPVNGSSTAPNVVDSAKPLWLPLDIATPGGARIDAYVQLTVATSSRVVIGLAWE